MRDTIYIVFDEDGHKKTRKTKPTRAELGRGESFFKQEIHVPDEHFETPPAPEVEVEIPVQKIGEPEVGVEIVDPEEGEDSG